MWATRNWSLWKSKSCANDQGFVPESTWGLRVCATVCRTFAAEKIGDNGCWGAPKKGWGGSFPDVVRCDKLKVPFSAGRLGEADQIWRSPDQSALLVGDQLLVLGPADGGHGDPFTREPPAVLDDVLDRYISANFAWQRYSVVIVDRRLDEAATAQLRAGRWEGREP